MTTIGGVAFRHLDRLPRVGDDINVEGIPDYGARDGCTPDRAGPRPHADWWRWSAKATSRPAKTPRKMRRLPPGMRPAQGLGRATTRPADAAQDASLRTGEESPAGSPSVGGDGPRFVGDAISEPSAGSVEIEDTRSTPRAPDLHARSEAKAEAEAGAEVAPDSPDRRPRSGSD